MKKNISENHKRILEAAEAIFIEKGVKDASLADIAREANISKGTLYYYYSSKSDLVFDIANKNLENITNQILSWIEESRGNAFASEILEMVFCKLTESPTLMKLHLYLLKEAVTSNDALRVRYMEKYTEWKGMIEESVQSLFGDKTRDAKLISQVVLAAIDGFKIQLLLGFKDLNIKDTSDFFAKAIK